MYQTLTVLGTQFTVPEMPLFRKFQIERKKNITHKYETVSLDKIIGQKREKRFGKRREIYQNSIIVHQNGKFIPYLSVHSQVFSAVIISELMQRLSSSGNF